MILNIYDRALQYILQGYTEINDLVIDFITESPQDDYRLNTVLIDGVTDVIFSRPVETNNYYITIKRYTANNGVIVEYGWTVSNPEREKFTFTPPNKFMQGELTYEINFYK